MGLNGRIARLARIIAESSFPEEPDPAPIEYTTADRVQGIRSILSSLMKDEPDRDPFRHLEGREYLVAFWPYFVADGETWPGWAREPAFVLGYPRDALGYAVAPCDAHGEVLPWPEVANLADQEGCSPTVRNQAFWRECRAGRAQDPFGGQSRGPR